MRQEKCKCPKCGSRSIFAKEKSSSIMSWGTWYTLLCMGCLYDFEREPFTGRQVEEKGITDIR